MEISAQRVGVEGPHGPLLRPTTLRVGAGELVLVAGDPGAGHTALALALSGRMRPTTGEVLADGRADAAALRRGVALVDSPGISEPEEALPLAAVVREELVFARRPSGRRAVLELLSAHDAGEHARSRTDRVPPALRCALLLELAASRPGVRVLVLDSPDRYLGDPRVWWELASAQVAPERSVVVLCTTTSAEALGVEAARIGEHREPETPDEKQETTS